MARCLHTRVQTDKQVLVLISVMEARWTWAKRNCFCETLKASMVCPVCKMIFLAVFSIYLFFLLFLPLFFFLFRPTSGHGLVFQVCNRAAIVSKECSNRNQQPVKQTLECSCTYFIHQGQCPYVILNMSKLCF